MNIRIYSICLLLVLLSCRSEPSEKIQAQYGNITEAVYASARVQPADHYRVFAEVSGIVEEKWINTGDIVDRGDRLFRIRNQTLDLQTANARLNYELAKANLSGSANQLEALKRQIDLARQQYHQDSVDYERQRSLWEQRIGSRQQLDQRALALSNSKTQYQSALDNYQQSLRQLKAEVKKADNTYRINANNKEQFILSSRLDGKVYELFVEPGETVNPQQPLAWIGSRDSFLVEMQVDEDDISRVQLGQKVFLHLDSYRDQVFSGEVIKIYPSMDLELQTFQVEARFLEPPPVLYPNLTAEANIVVHQKEKAVVIPRAYLTPGDSVILADSQQKRAVELGISDIRMVEVTEGLQVGERILKPKNAENN